MLGLQLTQRGLLRGQARAVVAAVELDQRVAGCDLVADAHQDPLDAGGDLCAEVRVVQALDRGWGAALWIDEHLGERSRGDRHRGPRGAGKQEAYREE